MKSKVWRSELVTGHGLAQYLFKILQSNKGQEQSKR